MRLTRLFILFSLLSTSFSIPPLGASAVQDSLNALLFEAIHTLDTVQVRQLISSGAKVNASDLEGLTPLLIAAGRKFQAFDRSKPLHQDSLQKQNMQRSMEEVKKGLANSKIIKLLLEAGADVSATDSAGRTPLILACSGNSGRSVKMLLEAGSALNVQDNQGNTALMYAVFQPRHIIAFLLNAGVDIHAENGLGETALDIAENNEMEESAAILREASLGEKVVELVKARLADRTLFSGLPEFMELTLLRKVNLEDKLWEFEIQEKYPEADYWPFSETEKLYTCSVKGRLQWPRVSGPFYEGTIRVGVAAGKSGIRALYYYGLDESAEGWAKTHIVSWTQTHKEGGWRGDKVLYHQLQDIYFNDRQERLYLLEKGAESYSVCNDESSILRILQHGHNPWIWFVYRVLEYYREREEVRSRFVPLLGPVKVADDQCLSAWCRGEIDSDGKEDLVCAVETDSSSTLAVILSSRADTVFQIAPFKGGGFTIMPDNNAIYLNYGDKPLVPCIWNGETFEIKPVD